MIRAAVAEAVEFKLMVMMIFFLCVSAESKKSTNKIPIRHFVEY